MLTLTLNTTQTQGWPTEAPPLGDCPVNQHAWAHLSRHTIPAPQHTLTPCTPTQGPRLAPAGMCVALFGRSNNLDSEQGLITSYIPLLRAWGSSGSRPELAKLQCE